MKETNTCELMYRMTGEGQRADSLMRLSGYLRRIAPEVWCVGEVEGMFLVLLSVIGCCRADLHVLGTGRGMGADSGSRTNLIMPRPPTQIGHW